MFSPFQSSLLFALLGAISLALILTSVLIGMMAAKRGWRTVGWVAIGWAIGILTGIVITTTVILSFSDWQLRNIIR